MKHLTFNYTVPLTEGNDGTVRVLGTRVTLDTIVSAFKRGNTAEQIQDSFPSLSLPQTYGVLAWYLEHQTEVEEYLNQRQAGAQALQASIEEQPQYSEFRETIRRRRQQLI